MTFAVKTYSGTLGSGTLLSQATLSTTIVSGQTPIPLVLTGIVSGVSLSLRTTSLPNGSGTAILDVNATDPSGATIIGSGNYGVPITVTATDSSVTLSSATVSAPNQPITVTATKPTIVELNANAPGLSANAFTPAILNVGGTYPYVYVQEFSKNSILVFPATASFPMAPLYSIFPPANVNSLGTNAAGTLALAMSNGAIAYYQPGSATPSSTITPGFPVQTVQLDSAGNTYALATGNRISIYAPGSSTPTSTISGTATSIVRPVSMAVDAAGDVFELDSGPGTGAPNARVNVWNVGSQSGNVAPSRTIALPAGDAVNSIASTPSGQIAVVVYLNTTTSLPAIQIYAPGAVTPSQVWTPQANVFRLAYAPNGDLFATGVQTVGVLAAGAQGPGYSRSFGPIGGLGHLTSIAVGGNTTATVPSTTTVSGDFIAATPGKTWNYKSTVPPPQQGFTGTASVYADPQPDISGNLALVAFISTASVPDAAAAGGTLAGAVGLSQSGGGYSVQSYGSVSNDSYGLIPGGPLLVPTSLTFGQQFVPYPGVTATVTAVGNVPGMSACPNAPAVGATISYAFSTNVSQVSYAPGCGITDLLTDMGTDVRLTSVTSNPQLGQQAIARRTLEASGIDTLRAAWKYFFRPWVKN